MRKIKIIILFIILLSGIGIGYGQSFFNKWYFGSNAGLDFNPGTPVSITGNVNTVEGSAAISDASGNLLFYTDGITAWNANHVVMPNGTGLLGNSSSTQSALIVPNPGNANQYYLFATPTGLGAFTYSIVDMTLAGGLGDITAVKNVPLHPVSTERATAVRHPNGTDIWIIGHEPDNDVFFAYQLTAAGFVLSPVLSSAGSIHSGGSNYIGYLKPSHQGDKLAIAIRYLDLFEIFDFDKSTGIVSNAITFPANYPTSYGVEFSPDDSRLYMSGGLGTAYIYQVNMNAGSPAAIIASSTLIANPAIGGAMGALQLGPDCKIYCAKYGTANLGVINDPDSLVSACNYIDNQVNLIASSSQAGLPNFFEMGSCCSLFTVNLGNDTALCQGQSIVLSGGSAASYLWSDGSTTSTITVTLAGTYWLQAGTGTCTSSDTIVISLNPTPTVNLGNDTTLCQGQTITLSGDSAASYLWSDGSTTSSITVSISGTYWLQANNGSCSATDTIIVSFNTIPVINLGNDTTLCQGQTITLTASGASAYLWSNGFTTSSITVSSAGTFWLQASNGQCSATDTIDISFNTLPIVNLGSDTTLCQGQNITLTGGAASAYLWSNGSTASSITVSSAGTFWLQASNGQCSATDTIVISFNTFPIVNLGNDTTLCQGQTITLTGGAASVYLWSDGSTVSSITVSTAGTYWLQSGNGLCSASDTIIISFNTYPVVSLGNDTSLCQGQPITLNGGTASTYMWSNGSTTSSIIVSTQGTYWLQAGNGQCSSADTITISFITIPVVNLGNDTVLCQGQSVTLIGGTGPSYLWSDGSTNSSVNVSSAGSYWLQASNAQCTAADTINISVNVFPIVNLGNDTSVCIGQTITLNGGIANTYLWSDGSSSPNLIAAAAGTYWVEASNGLCSASDSIVLTYSECEVALEFPNIFTPNGDYFNNNFVPKKFVGITKATLRIFNRWGSELLSTDNPLQGWSGYYKGSICPDGTYFWIVQYTTILNDSKSLSGTVTLLKNR